MRYILIYIIPSKGKIRNNFTENYEKYNKVFGYTIANFQKGKLNKIKYSARKTAPYLQTTYKGVVTQLYRERYFTVKIKKLKF